ncbi:bifunctional lytic transglycosylase/C40 family peptidase [Alkalibacillus silvisoli]|uniref:Bifunctional lytic transglycosylase/C40 family peptidase n=1 Tax=Alkalibacillus silvisoli TaxID=392823 RepID=A0ABP3JVK7_9BACI
MSVSSIIAFLLFLFSLIPKKWKGLAVLSVLVAVSGLIGMVVVAILSLGGQYEQQQQADDVDSVGNVAEGEAQVNEEVEALRPLFEQYAEEHGIPDMVEILMAKTMQESGGQLDDVMQSSESLGLPRNTISDPETSIDVGTEYFAQVLEDAGGDVELALQSYNFGHGFIEYAEEHNGGEYSKDLAIEFSREQYQDLAHTGQFSCIRPESAETGACFGDIGYVDAVLDHLATPIDAGDIPEVVEVGERWIGNSEYDFGGGRNEVEQAAGIFDCSSFVHWAFEQIGVDLGPLGSVTTETLYQEGQSVDPDDMQPGDMVFFDTYKYNGHIGIYAGDGQFIGAQSSTGVAYESLENGYWGQTFNGNVQRIG